MAQACANACLRETDAPHSAPRLFRRACGPPSHRRASEFAYYFIDSKDNSPCNLLIRKARESNNEGSNRDW